MDSDEEKEAVMAAITRSHPQPLVTHTLIPTRKKYQYVRMKEMLSHVLGGARGGGLFATAETNGHTGLGLFHTSDESVLTSPIATSTPELPTDSKKNLPQNNQNRTMQNPPKKTAVAAA